MRKEHGNGEEMTILTQFLVPASTIFTEPRMPKLNGFDELRANIPVFHTARWDFNCTGGSPTDATLSKLKGKRVGVISAGATAVQVISQVARWAGHLYAFQHTPSYCVPRRQQATDDSTWTRDVSTGPGWQRARRLNFNTFFDGERHPADHPDLVSDGWTQLARGFAGFIGGPRLVTPQNVEEHAHALYEMDMPLAEQARAHVRNSVMKDSATAEKLQPWYPIWCKRPTFQDGYLSAFNQENVTLVDTDGKGVERCTPWGLVANRVEYELDVLILARVSCWQRVKTRRLPSSLASPSLAATAAVSRTSMALPTLVRCMVSPQMASPICFIPVSVTEQARQTSPPSTTSSLHISPMY